MTFDFVGFVFGAIGAALLALNRPALSRWGFVFFLGSNVAWILYALAKDEQWLLLQTVVFSATSVVGVWQWFMKPQLPAGALTREHDVTSLVFTPRLNATRTRLAASAVGRTA